ncbi:MAG: WD40 repeat domain-containing protein, partial [Limisphaerales bacterium]
LYRFGKFVRRNKGLFTSAIVVVVALSVSTVVSSFMAVRARNAERLQFQLRAEAEKQQRNLEVLRDAEVILRQKADAQELISRRNAYAAHLNLAQQALAYDNKARSLALLADDIPRSDQSDLRGWEWRYIASQAVHSDELVTLGLHETKATCVAFSSSGGLLASGGWEGSLRIWDPNAHTLLYNIRQNAAIHCLSFSPDDKLLAVGCTGKLVFWSNTDSVNKQTFAVKGLVRNLDFCPIKPELAAISTDGVISVVDTDTWRRQTVYEAGSLSGSWRGALRYSPDGSQVAIGQENGKIQILSATNWKRIAELTGHTDSVSALAFTPDRKHLVSSSWDSTIKIWNLESYSEKATLHGHTGWVSSLAVLPDGRTIASASADQSIRVWNLERLTQAYKFTGHVGELLGIAASPTSSLLATAGNQDRSIKLWEVPSSATNAAPTIPSQITGQRFINDGATIAGQSPDGSIQFFDSQTSAPICSISNLTLIAGRFASMPNSDVIAIATTDAHIQVRNWRDSKVYSTIKSCHAGITCLRLSRDGKQLAVIDDSGDFVVFNRDSGARIGLGGTVPERFGRAAISEDLKIVAFSADSRREVLLYDTGSGAELIVFTNQRNRVRDMTFSPDNALLAVASDSGMVNLFNTTNGTRTVLKGHRAGVHSAVFSPDGKRLLTGGGESALKIWDVASGQELATVNLLFNGVPRWIAHVEFSADGNNVLATDEGWRSLILRAPSFNSLEADLHRLSQSE